jgi:hypothetical protein
MLVLSLPNLLVILNADNNDLLEAWGELEAFGGLLLLLFCEDFLGDDETGF